MIKKSGIRPRLDVSLYLQVGSRDGEHGPIIMWYSVAEGHMLLWKAKDEQSRV